MSTPPLSPKSSYRGSSPSLDRRGWTVAISFQEVFTAVERLRYNRQAVTSAESFRSQMMQALATAEQDGRARGYPPEDVSQAKFVLVAFLDETAHSCLPHWRSVQLELYGHQLAGEVFFQELQKTLNRSDSPETADLLEVYFLCLLLGFKGRYAAGGDLRSVMGVVQEKIRRIRGTPPALSPRGGLPADAVRLVQSDPWLKRLTIGTVVIFATAAVLFLIFKIVLGAGASELSNLTAHFPR